MKKLACIAFMTALALPAAAQVQPRMTDDQLMAYAIERNLCDDRDVVSVRYVNETENRLRVTCESAAGGLGLGGAGALAIVVGVIAAAAVSGGGGATPDTQ
jgi:hypothetical protein